MVTVLSRLGKLLKDRGVQMGTVSIQPQTSSPATRRRCPCINYVLTGLKCSTPLHHISLVDPWVQKQFVDVCKKSGWENIKIIIKDAAPHAVSLQAIHRSLPSECGQSARDIGVGAGHPMSRNPLAKRDFKSPGRHQRDCGKEHKPWSQGSLVQTQLGL